MVKINKFRTLEEGILLLQKEAKKSKLSIGEILRVLSGKGRPLILILLSIPFCQPLQIPGLSTPIGLLISFIGLRMVFGKRIWLPKKILEKKIHSPAFEKLTIKTLKLIIKMKSWTHPRLIWMCHSSVMEKVNGLTIVVLGILLALPLPIPLTNLTAAWSILLLSFGMIEDDGLFILVGYVSSVITCFFFFSMGHAVKSIFMTT